MRNPLPWFVGSALLLAAVPAQAGPAVLKTDPSALPTVRVYVPAPTGWKGGEARVVFDDKPSDDYADALAWLKADGRPSPLEAPTVDVPEVKVLPFAQQEDPAEGRLVVFLVDASHSMEGSGLAEVRRLARAVAGVLHPEDKVAITRFADGSEDVLPPTPAKERAKIDAALRDLSIIQDSRSSLIFDAMARTTQGMVQSLPNPQLPGRRFFFLFSDGLDNGSATTVDNFGAAFGQLPNPPNVFTVAVGSGSADRVRDLTRIASLAGHIDRFLSSPAPAALLTSFDSASLPLNDQLLVQFEAPRWIESRGTHAATLHLTPTGGEDIVIPLQLSFAVVPQAIEMERKAWIDGLDAAVTEWSAHATKVRNAEIGGGAAAGLVLVGFAGWLFQRRRTAAERRAMAEAQQRAAEEASRQEAQRERQAAEARESEQRLLRAQEETARRIADATRRPLAELVAIGGPLQGQRYGLFRSGARVGRQAGECDVVLPSTPPEPRADMAVSRIHAEFTVDGPGWRVKSLSQGTLIVAGRPVRNGEYYPAQFGDEITIGQSRFQFRSP